MARSLSQAQTDLGSYAQSKYQKSLSGDQWNQLAGAVNYAGGEVDDNMFGQAQGLIDQQFGAQAPQGPLPTPPPPQPQAAPAAPQGPTAPSPRNVFSGVDPNSSLSVQDAQAQLERMIGRPLTPQEQQEAMRIARSRVSQSPDAMEFIRPPRLVIARSAATKQSRKRA